MPLAEGAVLGPYEILSVAGAGGMGEVYRARDTRLDRIVALKLLPAAFAQDADRLRRFEQEARSVASLNHPNILAIHDVGQHDGAPYLVTEFLDGETVRERLNNGPISCRKAVEYAEQIAHGLAAAHERGIVHRDLKPENIFLTEDGQVKLLDFGLAKTREAAAKAASPDAPTMTTPTHPGMVLGTVGYMAPEQVRGAPVDHRADIFSFGAVLYEMLSGRRAFTGESSVETMNAILKTEPPDLDLDTLRVSAGLDRIIRHCLEKDPDDRFQSARDLNFALGALSGSESTLSRVTKVPARSHWMAYLPWALAGVFAIAALAAFLLRPAPDKHRQDFAIPVAEEVSSIALSPDGQMLAFVAVDENSGKGVIFVQPVGGASPTRLDGTEGATYPFWSPDNKFVAFFADGKLKKIPVNGGAPQTIVTVGFARGGSWGSKNVILYSPDASGPIHRVNPDGTNARTESKQDPSEFTNSHRWVTFLPDGEHYLFWSGNFDERPDDKTTGVYLGRLDHPEKKFVVTARSNVQYSSGQIVYVDTNGALVSVPIDIDSGKLKGQPQVVTSVVGHHPSTYWAAFSLGANGTLVYQKTTGAPLSQLTWYDRTGKDLGHVGEPGLIANPMLSPDGTQVAVDVDDLRANNIDLWIYNIANDTPRRFTFNPGEETTGVWSHDGTRVAYRLVGKGGVVMLKKSRGLERESQLYVNDRGDDMIPSSWTPDDRSIVCAVQPFNGGAGISLVSLDGKETPLINEKFATSNGQVSPDGKWLAYQSNESGAWEIYITPFPTPGGKLQISRGGGTEPRWRADGKEIFFIGPNGMLTASAVDPTDTSYQSRPVPLFQVHGRAPISSTDLFTYDVTKDGSRFLVNRYIKPTQIAPLNVVLNATSGAQQ